MSPRRRRRLLSVALLALSPALLAPSVPASAEEKRSAVEVLYDEAWAAMDRKDYDAACAKFEASFRIANATGPLQGLAQCEESRGRLLRALEHYRDAVRRLPSASPSLPTARAAVERLEARVGRLRLELASDAPAGTRVEIDGEVVSLPRPEHLVEAGVEHTLRVQAEGRREHVELVRVAGGEVVALTLSPGEPLASTAIVGPTSPAAEGSSSLRTAGLVVAGVGVAGGVVAAVTGALMLGAASDVDAACGRRESCADPGAAVEAQRRGRGLAPLNAVGFGVAGVGLVVGVTLFVLGGSTSTPERSAVRVRATPTGLSFDGRF